MIGSAPVLAVDAVIEAGLAVAVGVDDLLGSVLLRHVREGTADLQDIGRRIVQEHDIFPPAVGSGQLKGLAQPLQLPVHQLFRVGLGLLVPACDTPPPVQIKGALKGETLGADQGIIPVGLITVLQEGQPRLVQGVQLRGLFRVPEHVVVAPRQDLAARQVTDILQIQLALGKILSPAVVPGQDQRVLLRYQLPAVFQKFLLMLFPDPVMELAGRLQHGLIMQMKISDRIQAHVSALAL